MREEGLLKKLVAAHGVSGFEKNVRKIIEEEAAPYADEMTVDAIGNLIVLKKGTDGENKKKLMFAAHMDEIGFMVKKIEADGRLKATWAGTGQVPLIMRESSSRTASTAWLAARAG